MVLRLLSRLRNYLKRRRDLRILRKHRRPEDADKLVGNAPPKNSTVEEISP